MKDVTHEEREGPGYTLLGRGELGATELLAFAAGAAPCMFESRELAVAFTRLNPEIREQGWTLREIGRETLLDLLD